MDYSKVKVLVLDSGGRQTISLIRGLRKIGCHVTVICKSKLDLCYVSKYPNVKLLPKYEKTDEGWWDAVTKEVQTRQYDVLMPISEYTTNWVTAHEDELKPYCKLACASREVYMRAFNKQVTFETAMDIGIACPLTRREDQSVEEYLATVDMPIIVKPRSGVGSVGFKKITKVEQLYSLIEKGTVDPDRYVIQKCIHFDRRCSANIVMDKNGEVKTALAIEIMRQYPVDAGTATLIRTIDDPELIEDAIKLLRALKWNGFAQVSCMRDKDTGKAVLCEINGRIPAGVIICELCGINIAQQMIDLAFDAPITAFPPNDKFHVYARHFQADLMWFLKSPNRFHGEPNWFSWKNTTDYLASWKDPLPAIVYTIRQMSSYKKNMKKRDRTV